MPSPSTPRETSTTWMEIPGMRENLTYPACESSKPFGEQHENERHDHDHARSRGRAHIEIGLDLLPEMDRQHFGALVGKEERHRHIVERGHESEERARCETRPDQRQGHAAEGHPPATTEAIGGVEQSR